MIHKTAFLLPLLPNYLSGLGVLISGLILLGTSQQAMAQSRSGGSGAGIPALTSEDLNKINSQPLAPQGVNPAGLGENEERKPSFNYTDANGTQIKEYRDTNAPTEVQVKTPFTTYNMSPPNTVQPGIISGSDNPMLSVPSIRIPLN